MSYDKFFERTLFSPLTASTAVNT